MKAIEFVNEYEEIVSEIKNVVKPEYYLAIDVLLDTDPHDLIKPAGYFSNRNDAYGFVYRLLISTHNQIHAKAEGRSE